MKRGHSSTALVLIPALLAGFSNDAFAQEAQNAQAVALASLAQALKRTRPEKTKGDFSANNDQVWSSLLAACGTETITNACANAAIFAASGECEASAKFFKKSTTRWQVVSLVITLASAAFTGVGASTTIANTKIFSTLGGTTALGAVGATINANATGDQTGLAAVNSTLAKLQTFALGTGTPPTAPAANVIFTQARMYGAQCAAAANGSTANGSATTPSSNSPPK